LRGQKFLSPDVRQPLPLLYGGEMVAVVVVDALAIPGHVGGGGNIHIGKLVVVIAEQYFRRNDPTLADQLRYLALLLGLVQSRDRQVQQLGLRNRHVRQARIRDNAFFPVPGLFEKVIQPVMLHKPGHELQAGLVVLADIFQGIIAALQTQLVIRQGALREDRIEDFRQAFVQKNLIVSGQGKAFESRGEHDAEKQVLVMGAQIIEGEDQAGPGVLPALAQDA